MLCCIVTLHITSYLSNHVWHHVLILKRHQSQIFHVLCSIGSRIQWVIRPDDKQPASVPARREQGPVSGRSGWPSAATCRCRHDVSDLLPAGTSTAAESAAGDQYSTNSGGRGASATGSDLRQSHRRLIRHHHFLLLSMRTCRFHSGRWVDSRFIYTSWRHTKLHVVIVCKKLWLGFGGGPGGPPVPPPVGCATATDI